MTTARPRERSLSSEVIGKEKKRQMEIHIDESRCIGSGQCAYTAPGVFEVNDDGLSEVIDLELAKRRRAELDLAVRLCPTDAISVVS
jgi:ferredoxin